MSTNKNLFDTGIHGWKTSLCLGILRQDFLDYVVSNIKVFLFDLKEDADLYLRPKLFITRSLIYTVFLQISKLYSSLKNFEVKQLKSSIRDFFLLCD